MKKLIALVLCAAVLLGVGGWARAVGGRDLAGQAAVEEFRPGTVPAESAAMDGMAAPINATVLCMLERDMRYDAGSDTFRWASLYYMLSLYGQMDDRAELTDENLILPRETVEDYAAALFADGRKPTPVPEQLWEWIAFDAGSDSYVLARGDAELAETRLRGASKAEDGAIQVAGALVNLEDETDLCRFSVRLYPNESMFGYSISHLEIL